MSKPNSSGKTAWRALPLFVAILFASGLAWSRARDPFQRLRFALNDRGSVIRGIAVLPRARLAASSNLPVALLVRGTQVDLMQDGKWLRQIAEQGFAAVSFSGNANDQAGFDATLNPVLTFLSTQRWARTNSLACIAEDLGAERTLTFLARHSAVQPAALVLLHSRWESPTGIGVSATIPSRAFTGVSVWLVQGENDAAFPVEACRRMAEGLAERGAAVHLTLLPNRSHDFTADDPVLFRAAAEFCAKHLGDLRPVPVNARPMLWAYWIPALLFALGVVGVRVRRLNASILRHRRGWVAAAFLCLAAMVGIFLASRLTQPRIRPNQELAEYTRRLVAWNYSENIFREFVSSPHIASPTSDDSTWRRPLWEAFFPRVRHASDPRDAAAIVARFLRERVTIGTESSRTEGIAAAWTAGLADADGFERLYVAALRSAGVAARIGASATAEIFCDGDWQPAMRPLLKEVP